MYILGLIKFLVSKTKWLIHFLLGYYIKLLFVREDILYCQPRNEYIRLRVLYKESILRVVSYKKIFKTIRNIIGHCVVCSFSVYWLRHCYLQTLLSLAAILYFHIIFNTTQVTDMSSLSRLLWLSSRKRQKSEKLTDSDDYEVRYTT